MMKILLIGFLGLWASVCLAVTATEGEFELNGFSQPAAIAWNEAKQFAVADLQGITLGQSALAVNKLGTQIPSVLGIVWAHQHWWLADPANNRILKVETSGRVAQAFTAQALVPPTANTDQDNKQGDATPQPVAVAIHQNMLFWADRANHRICRFDIATQKALTCFGKKGESEGEFQYPYQLAFDRDGYLYVTDILNARVQVFDQMGRFFSQIGHFGSKSHTLFRPNGIAIDDQNDVVFVSDSYFGTIKAFKAGDALGELTNTQGQIIKLNAPTSLYWHNGRLFVVETGSNRIKSYRIDQRYSDTLKVDATNDSEVSQKNCVMCHLSWAKEGNTVDREGIQPDASSAMCYSCHNGAVLDSRSRIGRGEQHATVYDSRDRKTKRHQHERKDKLPDSFPRTADKELPCTSCHTPHTGGDNHDTLYAQNRNAWLRVPNKGGDLCERCHESKIKQARETDPHKRGINHPLAIRLAHPPFKDAQGYAVDENLHDGLPKTLKSAGSALDHNQALVCQSCHQIHGGHDQEALTSLAINNGQLCSACHERQSSKDKDDARHRGIHPVNVKPDKPMKQHDKEVKFVTCQTCHKVHDGQVGTPLLEKDIDDINNLCESCHQRQHAKDKDEAAHKGIHPVNIKMDDEVEIDGQKTKEVKCLTCHAVHTGKPDTPSLVEDHRDGQLCSHCHAGKQAIVGSDHDLRITAKKHPNAFDELPKAGVCSGCHSMHKGKNQSPHLYSAKLIPNNSSNPDDDHSDLKEDQLCLNCHQDDGIGKDKIVRSFSHPYQDLILRSPKTVMPLLSKKEKIEEFGEIACITCHDPHFWNAELLQTAHQHPENVKPLGQTENIEGSPLNSFLRTTGVKGTFCVDCHGLEALTKFKYYHDKEWSRTRKLDYIK